MWHILYTCANFVTITSFVTTANKSIFIDLNISETGNGDIKNKTFIQRFTNQQ